MLLRAICILVFTVTALSFLLASCANDAIINEKGTVVYMQLEGGFFGIISDDGESYDPVTLPEEFEVDGLRVEFTAKVADNQTSFHQWGTIIEILDINPI